MIKITANQMNNNRHETQIETSLSGSMSEILIELSSSVVAVINEITEPLPKEIKVKVTQDFITNVYLNIVGV